MASPPTATPGREPGTGWGLGAHLAMSLALSVVVMLACFPQMYWKLDYSLIRFQDTEFLYSGLFQLVRNMAQGRVQLWNESDQMPLAYFYLTGMMTYAHVLAAGMFAATQGVADNTAQYFYAVSILVFNFLPTVVRTVGFYLLARLFTSHGPTILVTTVLAGSIFNPQFHLGLNCTPIYSLMPLAMYFVLRFLDQFRIRDFCLALLVVTTCVATNPLVGLGYFYQGLHFFLLSALCWLLLSRRSASATTWTALRGALREQRLLLPLGATLLAAGLIMLPWVWLLLSAYPDYELAHSTSRFADPFTLMGYFNRAHFAAEPVLFFAKMLDFSNNEWVFEWVFVGWTCLFFSLCGAVLSKDGRKYIFIATIALFWLIQFPRDPSAFHSVAHWVNALTNPFNSVLRSAHMTGALLLPTMMIPLFVLGLDRVRAMLVGAADQPSRIRVAVLAALVGFAAFAALGPLRVEGLRSSSVVAYVALLGPSCGAMLLLLSRAPVRLQGALRRATFSAIAVMLVVDLWAGYKYFSQMAKILPMVAHRVDGIPASVNPVALDYQNPLVTPVREHYANTRIGQVMPYIVTDPNNMQGIFFRYTNLEKFFAPPSNYKPRHKSYAALASDPVLQEYVRRDSRLSFIADAAVRHDKGTLAALIRSGLDRRIVAIEAEDVPRASTPADLRGLLAPDSGPMPGSVAHVFRFADAKLAWSGLGYRVYALDLPAHWPRGLASGVFTRDRESLQVLVDGKALVPAQGWIVRAQQFDVQNIRAGSLHLSIADGAAPAPESQIALRFRPSTPLSAASVSRMEGDRIDFVANLGRPGWMVWHHPYDPHWRITVNGMDQRSFRANGAFVAFPLPAGESRVTMQYQAGSALRALIPLSVALNLLVIVGAAMLGYRSLRREPAGPQPATA